MPKRKQKQQYNIVYAARTAKDKKKKCNKMPLSDSIIIIITII